MSQRTETICDMCGARKGESNHWFKVEVGQDNSWLTLTRNQNKPAPGFDTCSENCTAKALSQFMSEQIQGKENEPI